MTVMQWMLDADDIPGALEIAPYALKYRLKVPNNKRPVAYLLAEEVALSAERSRKAGNPAKMDDLRAAIAMTAAEDMPDMVKAKLFKVTGLMLSDCGDYVQALEHLERAMQLDGHAGVRKEIQKCESALKPKPAPAAKEQPRARTRPPRRPSADAHARR